MRKPSPSSSSSKFNAGGGSFRDPAGFIYINKRGLLLRQINAEGLADFNFLVKSNLYENLTAQGLLVKHEKVSIKEALNSNAKIIIKPEKIKYITYPFEWSFEQLKDAALLTLNIQKQSLSSNMSLKDATAYNIQFLGYKAVFIDTLSFEKYKAGEPWQAYGQFCRHFLAPLTLMSKQDIRLQQLLRVYIDGIPLDLAVKLMPRSTLLKPGHLMHLFFHARTQKQKEGSHHPVSAKLSKKNQIVLIDSLERTIKSLKFPKFKSEWGEYYDKTNYHSKSADNKAKILFEFTSKAKPKSVMDLGGNDGTYSRQFTEKGIDVVCADVDPVAVQRNYLITKKLSDKHMNPVLVDLTNPSGNLGWANSERADITTRFESDAVIALALIHHLAISNNLPFGLIAEYMSRLGKNLIIEFVPKSDSQVKKLLSTRKDIFGKYDHENFEQEFRKYYKLIDKRNISGTDRTLYLFSK